MSSQSTRLIFTCEPVVASLLETLVRTYAQSRSELIRLLLRKAIAWRQHAHYRSIQSSLCDLREYSDYPRISFACPHDLVVDIDMLAQKGGCSRSTMIYRLLDEGIELGQGRCW